MSFLNKFFAHSSNQIAAPQLPEQQCLTVTELHKIAAGDRLLVPKDQMAFLLQKKQSSHLFIGGEHVIHKTDLQLFHHQQPLYLINFRCHTPSRNVWHYPRYTLPEAALTLALEGNYEFTITAPAAFCEFFRDLSYLSGMDAINDFIARAVVDILRAQKVPAEDIKKHAVGLGQFLTESLMRTLNAQGIQINALTIAAEETAPLPLSAEPSAHSPEKNAVKKNEPAPVHHASSSTLPTRREFFRVQNGEQIGPFSMAELEAGLNNGSIDERDLIWKKGMRQWLPVKVCIDVMKSRKS